MPAGADTSAMTTRTDTTHPTSGAEVNYTKRLYTLIMAIAVACLLGLGVMMWNARMDQSRQAGDCAMAQSLQRAGMRTPSQVAAACH